MQKCKAKFKNKDNSERIFLTYCHCEPCTQGEAICNYNDRLLHPLGDGFAMTMLCGVASDR